MQFSNVSDSNGIAQQMRTLCRVDSTQWQTVNIANSCNNWLDTLTGYAIGADRRFQWDDSNHTKLPIGTTNLVANQSDYSFLTDEQDNAILNLLRIDILDADGNYRQLDVIDQADIHEALDEYESNAGRPREYDKIADNVIRLYPKPEVSVTAGLKFYFQRTGSYFTASDTTKEPGVSPILHRGFVIASAYDCALTLGLQNLQPLSIELQREEAKIKQYFAIRNTDEVVAMSPCAVNPI